MVLVGAAFRPLRVDLTPVWHQEVDLIGLYGHGSEVWQGEPCSTYDLTRDLLLERVWGAEFAGDSRTVDVHIRWLREKIEHDPARPRYIQTVRGVGYRFDAVDEPG